ncbi:MAG: hypothetical protein ACMUJM_11570 [bacterium]
MNIEILAPLLRMVERSLIVIGGILSIYLGYRLFVLGIDKAQGSASGFGIQLKNFGPGLFFAALGAVVLVTTMRAAIKVGGDTEGVSLSERPETAQMAEPLFFGVEDTKRIDGQWTPTAFFLDTRTLLLRMDKGESTESLKELREGLKTKLDSITMNSKQYQRYQVLTQKVPLNEKEQKELQMLETLLYPDETDTD